jgi:hypothetical protein
MSELPFARYVKNSGVSACRSAPPLPPLRGERVGVRGACGKCKLEDAKGLVALGTREGAATHREAQTRGAPPSSHPSPPEEGGEGACCDEWKGSVFQRLGGRRGGSL